MGENEDLFGDEQLQKNIEALKLLVKDQSDNSASVSLILLSSCESILQKKEANDTGTVVSCKRTRCAITVPNFSERKSESTFRQEFMLAVLWLHGSKFSKDLSYNHEVPVSSLYVMFEGLLDTVINDTLIVSFAEQLDDEEFDPELCLSSGCY